MTENAQTLMTYEARAAEYIAGSPTVVSDSLKGWLDVALTGLDRDARIFEIGSDGGRAADYLEDLGYQVQTSDAASSFVDHLKANGHDALKFNVVTDEFSDVYDLILADAVFLHLTEQQFDAALFKTLNALNGIGGRFAFTVKRGGAGEGWSDEKLGAPRFFKYWSQAEIVEKLYHHNFVLQEDGMWLNVVCFV